MTYGSWLSEDALKTIAALLVILAAAIMLSWKKKK